MLLAIALAAAAPDDEPGRAAATRQVLDLGLDAFSGLGPESDARAAWQLGDCARDPIAADLLAGACARGPKLSWELRPTGLVEVGDGTPVGASGDERDGWVSARAGVRGALYYGPMVLRGAPSVGLDVAPGVAPVVRLDDLWIGYDRGAGWIGVGHQDRWMGPGRSGTLLLSDNAEAPWMLNGGVDGRLPGVLRVLGRFRAEAGVGVVTEARTDVALPGLLMMDFRWMPHPTFEIGLNRLAMFGGEGRPAPDVGQLLVPSEPHVEEDPDKLLPDQNELASMVVRANLPLKKWFGGPFGHLSGWWEYGGEDMIVQDDLGFDLPSLAGIGNQYGAELAMGPVVVSGEYTRLMDDYFRWYVGHRVYHLGFTQGGRPMGHYGGADSETFAARVAVWGPTWRVRVDGDRVRRVAVIDVQGDNVNTLPTEELQLRGGLSVDAAFAGSWFGAAYSLTSIESANFTRGNDRVEHRVVLSLTAGPRLGG